MSAHRVPPLGVDGQEDARARDVCDVAAELAHGSERTVERLPRLLVRAGMERGTVLASGRGAADRDRVADAHRARIVRRLLERTAAPGVCPRNAHHIVGGVSTQISFSTFVLLLFAK